MGNASREIVAVSVVLAIVPVGALGRQSRATSVPKHNHRAGRIGRTEKGSGVFVQSRLCRGRPFWDAPTKEKTPDPFSSQTWVDPNNQLFGMGGAGIITSGAGALQGSFEGVGNLAELQGVSNTVTGSLVMGGDNSSAFSMTGQVDITLDPTENINFTTTQGLSNVPEPVSLAVWSVLGCVAAAGAAFRRRPS